MAYFPVLGVAGAALAGLGLFAATQKPDRERVAISRPPGSSASLTS